MPEKEINIKENKPRVRKASEMILLLIAGVLLPAAMIVATALLMPAFINIHYQPGNVSVLTTANTLSYILIGVMAYLLGIAATLLVMRIRRKKSEKQ